MKRLSGAWWAIGLLVVLLAPPQLWLREPAWLGGPDQTFQLLGLAAAYVVATLIALGLGGLGEGRSESDPPRVRWVLWQGGATGLGVLIAFGLLYAVLALATGIEPAEGLFAVATVASASVIGLGLVLTPGVRGFATIGAGVVVVAMLAAGDGSVDQERPARESLTRATAHHRIRIDYHNRLVGEGRRPGGGLARIGESYVRMTGSGEFHRIRPDSGGGFLAEALPWVSPLNVADYEASSAGRSSAFRTLDLIGIPVEGGSRVFATHHYWHTDEACFAVRVSELVVDAELQPREEGWRPLYETSPCLTPSQEESRRPPGIQLQSGGRMAWLGPGQLLVTIGDHGFDGWNQAYVASQSDSWDYGRTLVVDVEAGSAETFAMGQRNPQGLHVDQLGRIWSTEHGPQGGDELNLLVPGGNYGWPYQTGGTDYGRRVWPILDESRGEFVYPTLAWVPSIGVTEVLAAPPSFPRWNGDLLVASLRAQTLFHLALSGDRVIYSEPIRIGRRIRDATYGPDGAVWLWTDTGDLIAITVMAEADRGEELFSACGACHLTDYNDGSGGIAPTLRGIVGRRVAAMDDFDYSAALTEMGGNWTAERLDAFIADPAAFAPGTSMAFPGIADPDDRAALITYLRELR